MRVKIVNVDIENVVKGKSRYSKATVAYLFNGEARTQNIMSFSNPAVFKAVQEKLGQEVEVTVTKNDAGYNQWASIDGIGEGGASQQATAPTTSSAPPPPTRVTGSNFETPAERAARQVYIVKQSSISSAIALSEANKSKASPDEIISTAQMFVDWVFDKDTSIESLKSDVL